MVLEQLIKENTHFNQEVQESVGYGDEFGMVQSMIEGVQYSQDAFEQIVNVGFAEAAAMHNVGSFTESTVEDMINEDAEQTSSDNKSDSGSGDKKGIGTTILDALKKLWGAFLNAVNTVINTIRTYTARDLKKFVANTKLKSSEELAKIKVKKFTKIKPEVLTMNSPAIPNYMGMGKEELNKVKGELKGKTKEIIKQATGIEAENTKEYYKKAWEKATEEVSDVSLASLVPSAKMVLESAKDYLKLLNDNKKKANDAYKKATESVKSKAKSVKKDGSISDEQGNKTEISDKDTYALASKVTLDHMKIVHEIEMQFNKVVLKLAQKDIAIAKSVYIKAAQGKFGNTSDDSNASEEVKNANESALLEYCEYDTELDMNQIQEQLESGEINPDDFE